MFRPYSCVNVALSISCVCVCVSAPSRGPHSTGSRAHPSNQAHRWRMRLLMNYTVLVIWHVDTTGTLPWAVPFLLCVYVIVVWSWLLLYNSTTVITRYLSKLITCIILFVIQLSDDGLVCLSGFLCGDTTSHGHDSGRTHVLIDDEQKQVSCSFNPAS